MSAASPKPSHPVPVYERDFYLWAEEQASALRERRLDRIDWENLAEEVEDLGHSKADALEGHCQTLIEHLLKIALAGEPTRTNNLRLWRLSIRNARHEIRVLLRRNPSLRPRAGELFSEAWVIGRNNALGKLDLDDEAIPEEPLFTFESGFRS